MSKSVASKATLARMALMLLAVIFVAGCSGQGNASRGGNGGGQEPEMIVVNEGMSKKEEEKLSERLAELEDEAEDRASEPPPARKADGAESTVWDAARAYYAAAADGDYDYTYDELSAYSRSRFTEDEWVEANTVLASDAAGYSVDAVDVVDDSVAEVSLTVDLPDGSSSGRLTRFVSEDDGWKHDLTQEEYDLFAGASGTSASASASASATPGASSSSAGDMDCSDFAGQAEAQAALGMDSSDPYGLDEDGDGMACETLAGDDQYDAADQYDAPDQDSSHERHPRRQANTSSGSSSQGGGDIDCDEVNGPIRTPAGDPNNLDGDGDGDGWACE